MLQPRYVVVVRLGGETGVEGEAGRLEEVSVVLEAEAAGHVTAWTRRAAKMAVVGPFPLWVAEKMAVAAGRLLDRKKGIQKTLASLCQALNTVAPRALGQAIVRLGEKAVRLWLKRRLTRAAERCLAELGDARKGGWWDLQGAVTPSRSAQPHDGETESAVLKACDGRGLLLRELVTAVGQQTAGGGPPAGEVTAAAEELVRRGELGRVAAVGLEGAAGLLCRRCGGTNVTAGPCWECGSLHCPACLDCKGLGQARGCQPLYIGKPFSYGGMSGAAPTQAAPPPHAGSIPLVRLPPGIDLTPAQKEAAARLSEWCAEVDPPAERASDGSADACATDAHAARECLIWAVCGAGKTEVLLDAIAREIGRGGRVLYATPRREVTLEVGARLAAALPSVEVSVAAGGLPGRLAPSGRLVVATAPQVVRFRGAFTLAAIDEVDAFPYPSDPMLDRAARRSLLPGGKLIYLTATPHRELLARVERGEVPAIRLLARHHGKKLPEPEVLLVGGNRTGGGRSPGLGGEGPLCQNEGRELARLLRQGKGARTFVFVSTVKRVGELVRALRAAGVSCEGCWAADPERPKKIAAFREGTTPVLITTSVLERGVTISGVDVIVWGADSALFATSQLVQMAGRAGRTSEAPKGRVIFAANGVSPQVKQACQYIREANRLALERGYVSAEVPEAV